MDEMPRPKVSIVMPVYNHEAFVWSACESVLKQDYEDLELICVDDGSTDASPRVLSELRYSWPTSRLKVVTTANYGAHAALNRGVSEAQGDVVMFLNSDDFYVAGRVGVCMRALAETGSPKDRWAFSSVAFIDEFGVGVDPTVHGHPEYRDYMYHVAMGAWAAEILPWHNIVLTSGNLAIGRRLLDEVGPFASLRLAHDWDMALRLLARVDPVVIADVLYLYRFHGSNTFKLLDDLVARSESAEVHKNWADAVATGRGSGNSQLPFVSRLRSRRGLRSAWDGA